ncbi:hypothetical protein INT47_005721 [Mucor saturninus]|uniref:Uncharacterized protein n=1 Tax=Mucor saturninus TaxID=64648 RepID=A0A8H7QGG8_9FUNG|nr:hypothetical protein INT47_005721 [Mucor saturninus]
MSQILYLYATIRTYEDYINTLEERLNEEDELLARLEHNETNYALRNRQTLDNSTLSNENFLLDRHLALVIMLRRLAYPTRISDLELLFGINKATIGTVFHTMIEILNYNCEKGIRFNAKHLHSFNLQRLSEATERKAASSLVRPLSVGLGFGFS